LGVTTKKTGNDEGYGGWKSIFSPLGRQKMAQKFKKQEAQKQIGRIRLSDSEDSVACIVGDDRLDLRVWVETDKYQGPTKRGMRFYLFDGIWEEFKKLVDKVDEEVKS